MLAGLMRDCLKKVPDDQARPELDDACCDWALEGEIALRSRDRDERTYAASVGADLWERLAKAPAYAETVALIAGVSLGLIGVKLEGTDDGV